MIPPAWIMRVPHVANTHRLRRSEFRCLYCDIYDRISVFAFSHRLIRQELSKFIHRNICFLIGCSLYVRFLSQEHSGNAKFFYVALIWR
jgi:hypothetical protein